MGRFVQVAIDQILGCKRDTLLALDQPDLW